MSYRKKSSGRSETPQGTSRSGKPTMGSMPFLGQLDSNLADIVRDAITGTLSEEDKDNFLMEILPERAWDGYQKWKFGNKEPDVSSFLNELSSYCRKTCENYIELGKLDMLEQVLIIKNVSPEAMKTFYTWKRMQTETTPANSTSFLDELPDTYRKLAESYIKTNDFEKLRNVLTLKRVSSVGMRMFEDWKSRQNEDTVSESHTASQLASDSDETSDEEEEDQTVHTATYAVDGCITLPSKQIRKIEKTTNTQISTAQTGNKRRPRTVFTVESEDKNLAELAIDELCDLMDAISMRANNEKMDKSSSSKSPSTRHNLKNRKENNSYRNKKGRRVQAETSSEEEDSREDIKSDCEEDDFRNDFSQKLPSAMNILVLGETGVGKSTFINGMVNYLKYHSIADALQEGVEILISSQFSLVDGDFNNRNIINKPTIPDEQGSAQNESAVTGESATQDPKSYVFQWSDERGPKAIRIIDTPGIGDTRGVDQDKKNFDKILSFISDYSELHAVCILIKPNTARLTLAFRFCIDELLVHLHKSASQNILFCFTNTRGTLYRPGDTLPTLRKHLGNLQAKRGIHIPTDKSTLFSFDNESFRFLCACKEGFPFSDTEKENFDTSWTRSVEETLRLFSRISDLRPHSVSDTLCLNNTRSAILTLSRPLAAIAKNQLINMKLIEDKMQEVKAHAKAGLDLRGKLHVDQVMLRTEEIDFPQTVCTAGKCVEHRRFNNDENALMQTIHKTICHDHCYLQGVKAETVPNPALQQCYAMHGNGSNCRVCGCQWELHMHIRYKLHEYMEKVVDPTVQASIANKENTVRTIEKFLEAERKKVDKLRMESEKITAYCAEFAAFLAKNSILPYNDSYRLYIEQLIKEEKEKIAEGGSTELLQKMENYKAEYEQQVSLLDKNMNNPSAEPRSVTDINRMVTELKQLENCGSILTEIQKLELLKVRETQQHMGKTVSLRADNSWLAAPKKMLKKGKKWLTGY